MATERFIKLEAGTLSNRVEQALSSAEKNQLLSRLWQHDHTLWSTSPEEISYRLGWLRLHETMPEKVADINELVGQVQTAGYKFALLLGMGGSSLAPEVFRKVFGVREGYLDLAVLDSTDPEAVLGFSQELALEKTLFIVSTKSGGTVETLSFFKYFYNRVLEQLGKEQVGKHFIAITDPGSRLEALAAECNFRKIFLNDPNLGGRYSALSYFGLVPAALLGVDISRLLNRAAEAAEANGIDVLPSKSEAVKLGALLGIANKSGLDKLTLISSTELRSFEDWVEQLVAESTGKSGKGILPVVQEPIPEQLESYSKDRIFVFTHLGSSKDLYDIAEKLSAAERPYVHLRLKDRYDLGKLILIWEMAVAVAGAEMSIHPFNQPNVESAKVLARQTVSAFQESGNLPTSLSQPLSVEALESFLETRNSRDYISLQAYINPTDRAANALRQLQAVLRDSTGLAVTVGFGPRFLHSTGQLHKGDGGNGMFIQLISHNAADVDIPEIAGKPRSFITFGVLKQAQAIGDALALQQAGRRLIVFQIESEPEKQIKDLVKQLE